MQQSVLVRQRPRDAHEGTSTGTQRRTHLKTTSRLTTDDVKAGNDNRACGACPSVGGLVHPPLGRTSPWNVHRSELKLSRTHKTCRQRNFITL